MEWVNPEIRLDGKCRRYLVNEKAWRHRIGKLMNGSVEDALAMVKGIVKHARPEIKYPIVEAVVFSMEYQTWEILVWSDGFEAVPIGEAIQVEKLFQDGKQFMHLAMYTPDGEVWNNFCGQKGSRTTVKDAVTCPVCAKHIESMKKPMKTDAPLLPGKIRTAIDLTSRWLEDICISTNGLDGEAFLKVIRDYADSIAALMPAKKIKDDLAAKDAENRCIGITGEADEIHARSHRLIDRGEKIPTVNP